MVSGNRIHAAPHTAIKLSGNDHVVEENEIYDVARDTGDVGAIYAGRSLFMRGNVVRRNFLHDNGGGYAGGVSGVYLDDMFSGVLIEANVFVRSGQCVFIGGGRDNTVRANLFVGCAPAIHLDERGVTTHALPAGLAGNRGGWGLLDERERLLGSGLYARRYPALGKWAGARALEPNGNIVADNIIAGAGPLLNADAPRNPDWFRIAGNRQLAGLTPDADTAAIRTWAAGIAGLHDLYFGTRGR